MADPRFFRRARQCIAAWCASGVLTSSNARAEDQSPPSSSHRIGGALNVATGFINIASRATSEDTRIKGTTLWGIDAIYGYKIVDGLEVGAAASFLNGPQLNGFVLSGRLRPYVPIGDRVEIGLPLRVGLLAWPAEELWLGWAGSLSLDCTVWLGSRGGFNLHVGGNGGLVNGPSIREAGFFSLGGGVGVIALL